MWLLGIGIFITSFAFGYTTGLSKTPGTVMKALGILAGFAGAVAAWVAIPSQFGLVLTCIGLGFSIGITIGAKLRRNNILDIMDPSASYYIHNEANTLTVAVIQSLFIGLPLGVLVLFILKALSFIR
jgi:hypothetical protein